MASGKARRRKRAAQRSMAVSVKTKAPARINGKPVGTVDSAAPARRPVGRDRRPWVLGAVAVAIAIAIAVAVGAAIVRSDQEAAPAGAGSTLSGAGDAVALFKGIPQNGVALGRPKAPVTLIEFVDPQCPFCRQFAVQALPTLVDKYVRPGKVRMELRGLAFLGPDSERGMRAAFAAGRQGRMFELLELLYYNQGAERSGWLSEDLVEAAARSLPGLDVARLVDDMSSSGVSHLLHEHAEDAKRRGVTGTPAIYVGRTGGDLKKVPLTSATDLTSVERAIAAAR